MPLAAVSQISLFNRFNKSEAEKIVLLKHLYKLDAFDISKEDFIPTDLVNLLKDRIIYENDDYLAINKPEGIASHGGSGIKIGLIETIRNFGKNYRECKKIIFKNFILGVLSTRDFHFVVLDDNIFFCSHLCYIHIRL